MSDATDLHELLVPMGCQVSSKGRFRFCKGFGPEFIARGDGAYVWDDKGRQFLDWTCGLGALTLGHNRSINGQPQSFPLPSDHETELASELREWIPCAEQSRFLKTGTDATTACIRLARAHTGRSGILTLGSYHGWADWSLDDSKQGCPEEVRLLTHRLDRNEIALTAIHAMRPAAVILEPVSLDPVDMEWLTDLREACTDVGAVLIFDEVITGIRLAKGGAQEIYGVTPDLCAIGKGMANGWPISAVCGRAQYMAAWSKTHISGTHFGDPMCMQAALSCMQTLAHRGFWNHQELFGGMLMTRTHQLVEKHGLTDHCRVWGHPHWWCLQIADPAEQTLWQQECLRRSILTSGSHFITLAHCAGEVDTTIAAYDEALSILKDAIDYNDVASRLQCAVNTTVFRRH